MGYRRCICLKRQKRNLTVREEEKCTLPQPAPPSSSPSPLSSSSQRGGEGRVQQVCLLAVFMQLNNSTSVRCDLQMLTVFFLKLNFELLEDAQLSYKWSDIRMIWNQKKRKNPAAVESRKLTAGFKSLSVKGDFIFEIRAVSEHLCCSAACL